MLSKRFPTRRMASIEVQRCVCTCDYLYNECLLFDPGGGFLSGRRWEQAAAAMGGDDAGGMAWLPALEQRPMLNTAVRSRVDMFGRAAGGFTPLRTPAH